MGIKQIIGGIMKNKGATANALVSGYFGHSAYNEARQDGKGVVSSAAHAATEMVLPMVLGGWGYMGYLAVTELPGAAVSGVESFNTYSRQLAKQGQNVPFGNATFIDTEQAYTMRQAGMALAQQSKYNVQQALIGSEAKSMHR